MISGMIPPPHNEQPKSTLHTQFRGSAEAASSPHCTMQWITTSRSHQPDFLLLEETPRDHETKKRINEMECRVFQGQRRGAGENRKRREQSVTHRHPRAVEISTTGARAHPQALTPRFQGHVAARRRRVPETTRSREEGYHKLGNAMKDSPPR